MLRRHFHDLPSEARQVIADKTGPVLTARTTEGGLNSGIAAFIDTADGPVFVKGIPTDHPQAPAQRREAAIAPHLPRACPRLYWHIETAGWDLLGYEVLQGHHADYTPGSANLPLVVAAVQELQEISAPRDIAIKSAEQRWAAYAPPGTADLFAGDTLLHTDLAPHNVLVNDRAHIIDWAWPTRGAAWIDPAVLILRLLEAGHSLASADSIARQLPSWHSAPVRAVQAFAAANAAAWAEIARQDSAPWKAAMARHAVDFHTYVRTISVRRGRGRGRGRQA
ncbi:aminoglycoside phosphotransferase [Streptomyces sp. VNUA24]|uniref:aminoglycoside phosphotransferase n=1 Tax=Streptomyces sp. VNUA24 TaxID=3031131 RepID=UPI0023B7CFF3|nr:aminoglycoside phosphotransferase [Streptomyces sp. VNUA24]WEH20071.1 aminoglycoside phosphotransferase [Streptomyces sp. VNUA24]